MGLLKWIAKKFKCESKCMYNIEDELFDNNILDHTLNQYSLKMKDMKRILKILNKRERISFPVSTQSTHSTHSTVL